MKPKSPLARASVPLSAHERPVPVHVTSRRPSRFAMRSGCKTDEKLKSTGERLLFPCPKSFSNLLGIVVAASSP